MTNGKYFLFERIHSGNCLLFYIYLYDLSDLMTGHDYCPPHISNLLLPRIKKNVNALMRQRNNLHSKKQDL